jgi:hypothetical protein|tara:strand:+ start:586 stop:762 length:177 start_codon:yes stop_codon:yes gene_type:complete
MKIINGCQDLATKPTAKFLPSGLIKYFDSVGNYIRLGFKFKDAALILKNEGYNVVRDK